ncbi:MAG: hypothetical protein ACYCT9_12220 [Leptospirillum sp.]
MISASEMQSLNTFHDSIVDTESLIESDCPFHICYGCYMPQRETNEKEAREDLMSTRDHFLGFVHQDKCHIIACVDVMAMDTEHIGMTLRIPFSALIKTTDFVIEQIGNQASQQAVTGFLLYNNMSPATNILNRPGIIALKGLERRRRWPMTIGVNPENWRKHIDPERAKRIASGIK